MFIAFVMGFLTSLLIVVLSCLVMNEVEWRDWNDNSGGTGKV